MTAVLNTAAVRIPPRSGNVQIVAATTTAAATALDTDFPGNWVTVRILSGTVYVLFGGSAVTVDATASDGATLGKYMTVGDSEDWQLSDTDTHIATDCAASTATIEITKSGR